MVVHGEQRLSVTNPLPVSGDFITNAKVIGCYDKGPGKGAIIEVETTVNLKKDNTEIVSSLVQHSLGEMVALVDLSLKKKN